jgi:hypothetical protein
LELSAPKERGKDSTDHHLPPNSSILEDTVYLGGNSVPAMVIALGWNHDQNAVNELLDKSILPVFGLDNDSATYPFVDLWGIPHGSPRRIELLTKLLPADADCIQVFRQYRDTAHVIYPGLIDIIKFESDLSAFLTARRTCPYEAQVGGLARHHVYGQNIHWLGLLFAALASGFQCSNLPRKERQMKSQVYGIFIPARVYCFSLLIIFTSLLCLRVSPYCQLPLSREFGRHTELASSGKCHIK